MFKSIKKLGFTMIELLIVIAVLGILAVAVLAAINPIEQINRGRDTGSRSDAEQTLSAIDRFYASQGYYPWRIGANDVEADGTSGVVWTDLNSIADSNSVALLDKLSTGGTAEIKTSFVTRVSNATYNALYVYNRGEQGDSTYVCFVPKSGAFAEEASTRCVDSDGSGLPEDLVDEAVSVCGTATAQMVCLP